MSAPSTARLTMAHSVLGGLLGLGDPAAVTDLIRRISSDAFTPEDERILGAIITVVSRGEPARASNVASVMVSGNGSGADYNAVFERLTAWSESHDYPSPGRVRSDIDVLNAQAYQRSATRVLESVAQRLEAEPLTEAEVQGLVERAMREVLDHQPPSDTSSPTLDGLNAVFERFAYRQSNPGVALSLGYAEIDDITDGAVPKRVTVYGAQPGIGKTAAALDAVRTWIATGYGAVFVSYEMPRVDLLARLLCAQAGVNFKQWMRGKSSQDDVAKMQLARGWFEERHHLLHFIEASERGLGIDSVSSEVIAQCAMWRRTGITPGGFAVDYLQLIPIRPGLDIRVGTSANMLALVSLAHVTNTHALILSQLNRQSGETASMRDLKETGQIDASADAIFILGRPETTGDETRGGEVDFHCVKDRHSGAAGRTVVLHHNLACATFRTGGNAADVPPSFDDVPTNPWL